MKFAMLLGGLLGFAIPMAGGLLAGRELVSLMLPASLTSIGFGLMARWLSVLFYSLVIQHRANSANPPAGAKVNPADQPTSPGEVAVEGEKAA